MIHLVVAATDIYLIHMQSTNRDLWWHPTNNFFFSCEPPFWQYLGMLSNAKPSAIFKVGRLRNQVETNCFQMLANRGSVLSHEFRWNPP